jgi:hypothetical protein
MTKTIHGLALTGLVVALAACGGRDDADKKQPQYETVQEGQAAGVTSTIHGPGEIIPPMTGTNADTTSAFTIDPSLANTPATPPGTLAGTLPSQPYGGAGSPGYMPPAMTSSSRPATTARPAQPAPQPQSEPQRGDTTWSSAPPPATTTTQEAPPVTTTTAEAPPPPTDTASAPPPTQTDTNAPPPEKPPAEKTDSQQTETAPPPPPPPGA